MFEEKKVLVDASGIKSLGGLIHIRSLLRSLEGEQKYIVTLIGSAEVVDSCKSINVEKNVQLRCLTREDSNAIKKNLFFWSRFVDHSSYDRIFICNGIYFGSRKNVCLILQNQLPFHFSEIRRYFPSIYFFKFLLLFILFCLSSIFSEYTVFVSNSSKVFISKNKLFKICSLRSKKVVNHISVDELYPLAEVGPKKLLSLDQVQYTGIYLASIERYRNHEALTEALDFLTSETDLNLRVVCAGQANAFVRRKIAGKKGSENLILIEMIPRSQIDDLVENFDLGFYLSSCESFGLGLVDKVLRGLPTVVLKTSISLELLGPSYPFFVEDLSPENIAKVCKMILLNNSSNIIFDFNQSQLRVKRFNTHLARSQIGKYL